MRADDGGLIRGDFDPRFVRLFSWYVRRLVRRRFHAVRMARASRQVLSKLDDADHPVIVLANHCSWWDPLVLLLACGMLMPSRRGCAAMDRAELQRFRFMRRLGVFGVDPDDPASLESMREHVLERFAVERRPTLVVTPQGRFADVRAPIRLRPGAAAIAARAEGCAVVTLALEYVFWQDQRPEVLLRAAACRSERPTTAAWQRAMQESMQRNADALAALAVERDERAFEPLVESGGGRTSPMYDLLLRLRGRSGPIGARREGDRR